jgi:MFS family permease
VARAKKVRAGLPRACTRERALDWLNLFVANIQTGFGPFIAVYLTTEGWTQTEIGLALSVGTVTAVASQLPAGALVDASRRKSMVGVLSILACSASALLLALWPLRLPVYLAEVLHGFSSCTLAPVIAAVSLALAGRVGLGLRLGRNARFASVGNGVGALLMGAAGYYISERSVFFLTAALTLPALAAFPPLWRIGGAPPAPGPPNGSAHGAPGAPKAEKLSHVLADKRLLIFALCGALFTFANAPMLPLASSAVTLRAGSEASLLIAACIVLPQLIVAAISPSLGQLAEVSGRRLVLIVGFAMLPLRGLLFAVIGHPTMIVLVQALDGISAASFGVMVPLIVADIAGRSGHFNFSLGFIGFAVGVGATFSTTVAGWIADKLGDPFAFVTLALVGLVATLLVWLAMPETRPPAGAAGAEA